MIRQKAEKSSTVPVKLLGNAIRAHREAAGLTQGALAKKIGKSVTTISKIEAGKQVLHFGTLCQIAETLDTSPLHLVWKYHRARLAPKTALHAVLAAMDKLLEAIEPESAQVP